MTRRHRPQRPARLIALALVLVLGLCASVAEARNLHLIEKLPNGYAIYRLGKPDEEGMLEMRELGIQEIAVLSGNAEKHEEKYRHLYPELEVVYNEKQRVRKLPDPAFLDWFDAWVEEARREGKIIAFRCDCGCHRTGRLAAYYQMKWQNLTYEDAVEIMMEHGRRMFFYPSLPDQVRELQKRIEAQRTAGG
jgi:protein-tyrosine phosphatase